MAASRRKYRWRGNNGGVAKGVKSKAWLMAKWRRRQNGGERRQA
jgi:hypothetical protein